MLRDNLASRVCFSVSLNNARQFATITHIIPWEETLALETPPSQTQLLPRQSVVILGGPGLGETVISWSTPGRMWVYNPQPELSELEDSGPVNKESLLTARLPISPLPWPSKLGWALGKAQSLKDYKRFDGHQLPPGTPSPLLVSFPSVTKSGLGACTRKELLSSPFPCPI